MIKCKIFQGDPIKDDNGKVFQFIRNGKVDKGHNHFCSQREFELEVKKWNLLLGYYTDAYDKDDNLIWSNYQDVEVKSDNLAELRIEYKELSGEDADKRWKENKLIEKINELKEK